MWLYHYILTMYERSSFFTSLPKLGIVSLLNFSHFPKCVIVPNHGFNSHVFDDWWYWTFLCAYSSSVYFLQWSAIPIFYPFFKMGCFQNSYIILIQIPYYIYTLQCFFLVCGLSYFHKSLLEEKKGFLIMIKSKLSMLHLYPCFCSAG